MKKKDIALMILTGLLLAGPYMVSDTLIFVYLIPLFYVLYSGLNRRGMAFIVASSAIGASIGLAPVLFYSPAVYLIGIGIIAGFAFLFTAFSGAVINRLSGSTLTLIAPVTIWLVLYYLFNIKSLMSASLDIGVLFPNSTPVIWYIGSIGMTALIVLFNSAAARFLVKKDGFSLAAGILLLIIFLSSSIYSAYAASVKPQGLEPKNIALIQGDVAKRGLLGFEDNIDDRIKRYAELTEKAIDEKTDLVVWPEYTFPVDIFLNFPDKAAPVTELIKKTSKIFVIGSLINDAKRQGVSYNGVLMFDRDGKVADRYYSLQPFIFSKQIAAGVNNKALFIDRAGIALCWEETNENIFRKAADAGCEYFVSLSSNIDLDNSWLKGFASYFSRARAAENMRYLVRASQSGVTQIAGPYGNIVKRVPTDRATSITGTIYKIKEKTFYSRHGDIVVRLATIVAGILIILGGIRCRAAIKCGKTQGGDLA